MIIRGHCLKCGASVVRSHWWQVEFSCHCNRFHNGELTYTFEPIPQPEPEPQPVHKTLIDEIIYDDEPAMAYRYLYYISMEHVKTCKLCASLRNIGLACLEMQELRKLRTKWLVFKTVQKETTP